MTSGTAPPAPPRGATALVVLGTALVLVTYVTPLATIVATGADLQPGPAARAWVLSSMSVGLAAALLATGVLGDAMGRRRTYVAGLLALGAGAAVCAAAPGAWVLVAGRLVQGVGGAAVLSCGLAVLAVLHPAGPARARATAAWGAGVGLGISLGVVLTAALGDDSWRPAYAVTALLAAALLLPSHRGLPAAGPSGAARRVDAAGLVLLVAAMSAVVAALTEGRDGPDAVTLGLGAAAVVALAAFVVVERRVRVPLLDPRLLGSPRFAGAVLASFVLGVGMIGLSSFAPVLAQTVVGVGLWGAAVPVLAWSLTSVATSVSLRWSPVPLEGPVPLGVLLLLVAAAQATATGVDAGSDLWRLTWPFLLAGVPTGALNALLGREAVASVPPERAAMGSGAGNTARYLGAACGITLVVVVATHAGDGVGEGWGVAAAVCAAATALGAALVLVLGHRARVADPAPARLRAG